MKVLVVIFVFNEAGRLPTLLKRFPRSRPYDLCLMDDGSTDGGSALAEQAGVPVLRHEARRGVGAALWTVHRHALEHGYDVIVPFAGNNKDDPALIPRLLAPIERGEADLVQGSRFLAGGGYTMPWHRVFATKYVHPVLLWLACGRRMTETTNGFRAYRTTILKDPRLDLQQPWLDRYALEPYFLCQAIRLGYRVVEVPVTKHYPVDSGAYSKMRPLLDWWDISKPLIYLALRLKR